MGSHPALRPFLQREHVALDWDGPPAAWLEPPQVTVTIMLAVDGSLHANGARLPDAWIGGPGGDCSAVEMSAGFSTLDVQLTPLGARSLLGLPMHELAGRTVALDEVLGPELLEEVREAPTWTRRTELLDAMLLARVERGVRPSPTTARAYARLRETGGRIRIDALARELACSRRLLESAFRDDVGLPPKTVARLLRFAAVRRRIEQGPARWADIAYEHGYSDQAHLNRDFRDLAGTTPGAFAAQARSAPAATA